MKKTLVLGLGNPILGDDGVGLLVTAQLKTIIDLPHVSISSTELGGINLLELLAGYDRAIIVDAIKTPDGTPGQIYRLSPDSLYSTRHIGSTHSLEFAQTIELGRKLNMDLPHEIIIFGIEAEDVSTFGEECSPRVKQAIHPCVERIRCLLNEGSIS